MKALKHYFLLPILSLPMLLTANTARLGDMFLQTDKQVYVSGDNIRFKCTLANREDENNKVLFVDICGEGYHIASRILKPSNNHWNGSINLPDTLQTGVYLLRAYWGNETGVPTVLAMPLPVFNRFGNNEVNVLRREKRGYRAWFPGFMPLQEQSEKLKLSAPQARVKPGESVKIKVENLLEKTSSGVSMAVFKNPENMQDSSQWAATSEAFLPSDQVKIYPQLIVAGKVTSNELPAEGATVLLSVPDSVPGINFALTDSMGEFRFIIEKFYGKTDFVLQTMDKQRPYQLTLYPGQLLPPAEIPFFLTESFEQSEFVELAVKRAGINLAYAEAMESLKPTKGTMIPFYGFSNTRILPGIYVPLNDFKEIALEILPTVKYTLNRDSTGIRLWDPVTKGFYHNPWILVDGVPVFNAASLNVLHSEKIKWIDLQPQVRCYGNLLIEGLMSIQTVNGDFTDVEFPVNALRKQVDTFHNDQTETKPEKKRFNDVLYWEPVLNMPEGSVELPIETSLETGKYTAVIQAVDEHGLLHQHSYQFTVEP